VSRSGSFLASAEVDAAESREQTAQAAVCPRHREIGNSDWARCIWAAIQNLEATAGEPALTPAAQARGKGNKPRADVGPKPRSGTKTEQVIALLKQPAGATLKQLMSATSWQAHYADARIMPTCVGNPACGAGIAAMESA